MQSEAVCGQSEEAVRGQDHPFGLSNGRDQGFWRIPWWNTSLKLPPISPGTYLWPPHPLRAFPGIPAPPAVI